MKTHLAHAMAVAGLLHAAAAAQTPSDAIFIYQNLGMNQTMEYVDLSHRDFGTWTPPTGNYQGLPAGPHTPGSVRYMTLALSIENLSNTCWEYSFFAQNGVTAPDLTFWVNISHGADTPYWVRISDDVDGLLPRLRVFAQASGGGHNQIRISSYNTSTINNMGAVFLRHMQLPYSQSTCESYSGATVRLTNADQHGNIGKYTIIRAGT